MKKVAYFLVVLLSCISVLGSTGCGQPQFIIKQETLTVGAELDVPWLMEKGISYEGFGFDVLKQVADELGLKTQFVPTSISTRLTDMNGDKYDVLGAPVVRTPDRKEQMDITVPVASTSFKLVVFRQSPLKGQEELKGMLAGAVESSKAMKLAKAIPGIRDVTVFPHDDEMYAALRDGTVDVIVSPSAEYTWRNRKEEAYTSIGEVGETTEWGFGVKKGNTELLSRLNQALGRMKEDGSLAKLQEKWLGE